MNTVKKKVKKCLNQEIIENPHKASFDLVYFILNTLNLIQSNGYWYCYCNEENDKKCILCTIPTNFYDFENDVDKKMFNIDFLKFYHSKLCHELRRLFDEDKSTIECFLHQECEFKGRD